MSSICSADDLANLEAASRCMLSPLNAKSIDAWRTECMQAVRRIVGAESAMFAVPGTSQYVAAENADPHLMQKNRDYLTAMLSNEGDPPDPVVKAGFVDFLTRGAGVYNDTHVHRVLGDEYRRSAYYNEIVVPLGGANSYTLFVPNSAGHVMLSCWGLSGNAEPGVYMPLLRALVPSLSAGIQVLSRLGAYTKVLDQLSEPLMFYSEDTRELHRNTALVQLLNADPERETIRSEIDRVGKAVSPVRRLQNESPVTNGSRSIRTGMAEYAMRGTLLPPGTFVGEYCVLVSVTRKEAPRLPPVDELCSRFSLTRRESEVAVLLAEGLSNTEIADRLYLSQHTARRHTANIFDKLEVSSRKALALKFLRV